MHRRSCDAVPTVTPFQAEILESVSAHARRLVHHMQAESPVEPAWTNLRRSWTGRAFLGPTPGRVTFDRESGCLAIGVPATRTDAFDEALLATRTVLALTRAAAGSSSVCTDLYARMLTAAASLGIQTRMQCEDVAEFGLIEAPGVPRECLDRRVAWPEYRGKHVRDVLEAFQARPTELMTVDSLWNRPPSTADPETVRIVYDPRTGQVAVAPFVSSAPPPAIDDECFARADPGFKCVGAPLAVPGDWQAAYVGKLLPGVLDDLRMRYPHALIDPVPRTATVSGDRRMDRIRVRFDDAGIVSSLALG